jgi:uncharacterized protein YcbK (DUF882 family)
MSKRLLTASVGIALGLMATHANARPQDTSFPSPFQHQYDGDDDDDAPRRVRRHARAHAEPRHVAKQSEQGSPAKRSEQGIATGEPAKRTRQSFMRTEPGTARGCLTASARALLGRIEAQFGAVQIVSTCRPGARIAGSGRISRHASGNAIDFDAGRRKGAVVRWLIANHKSGGTMSYSDMSHIHVDIGPHFVSLGANSGG